VTRESIAPATTSCLACPLRALEVFKHRSRADVSYIQAFKAGEEYVAPVATLIRENEPNTRLFTVLSGWLFRYRTLDGGHRRQIINYGLPGDFMGLQATLDDPMSHGIEALTNVTVCYFEQDRLWELFADHPQLSFDITWLAAQQERSFEDQLLTLGQRTGFERVAYLLWHLFDRARDVGLAVDNVLELPLRQQHLADTLGLSLVHTNKTLQKIRELGAIDIRERCLYVLDEAHLRALGRVDTSFSQRRPLL
jgi:CRP/FNR family transcriptional regulator